jgi:hypothetical protein
MEVPQQLLGAVSVQLPAAPEEPSGAAALADAAAVGRFGEELAHQYYMQHPDIQQQQQNEVVVEWVNQEAESGLPYDLVVYEQPVANAPGGSSSSGDLGHLAEGARVLAYVEVKASRKPTKQLFQIAEREMEFARQQGSRYHILRVGLAGAAPSIQRLVDPVRLWAEHVIRVCIAV